MEELYGTCCGVDVHKKLIVACLRKGKQNEIRETGGTTKELLELSDWLKEAGCEKVAMESTGSYWKPVYNVLEATGISTMVVNAQHMKAVPGRKTDVKDAVWIADLLQHGLLMPSFIPMKEQRELRELVTYRRSLIEDRAREMNRLQKMLEGGNIKLSGTVSNIDGKSARNILNCIIGGGKFDGAKYDEMLAADEISWELKATKEQLVEDLNGVLSPIQLKMLQEVRKHMDELKAHIEALDAEIGEFLTESEQAGVKAIMEIPGIGERSAQAIIAVIGTDMSRWPTERHMSKWAGLCPGDNISANKRKSGKTTKGNELLRTTLVNGAHAAVRNKKSYFYAQFQRLSSRMTKKKAYVAVAHSMLIAIYQVLKKQEAFKDLGSEYYNQFNREKKAESLIQRLKGLGFEVTINAVPSEPAS